MVVSNIFYVHPYLGKISNLTNIFQMGWNHQLDSVYWGYNPLILTFYPNFQPKPSKSRRLFLGTQNIWAKGVRRDDGNLRNVTI